MLTPVSESLILGLRVARRLFQEIDVMQYLRYTSGNEAVPVRKRMVVNKKKRFTLDLEPATQRRLKVAAAVKGVSMRQYCLDAIEKELARDHEARSLDAGLSPQSLLHLIRLRNEIFGGVTLPGDSTDLIRKAREARSAQL